MKLLNTRLGHTKNKTPLKRHFVAVRMTSQHLPMLTTAEVHLESNWAIFWNFLVFGILLFWVFIVVCRFYKIGKKLVLFWCVRDLYEKLQYCCLLESHTVTILFDSPEKDCAFYWAHQEALNKKIAFFVYHCQGFLWEEYIFLEKKRKFCTIGATLWSCFRRRNCISHFFKSLPSFVIRSEVSK